MSLVDSVEHLRTGLDYHLQRHNLLASNLAHLDTPGYAPVDLRRNDFQGEMHVAMAATHNGHVTTAGRGEPGSPNTSSGFQVIRDPSTSTGGDSNGVDVDKEAVKITTNQLRYDMLAQLASSELASLSWAANDGKGGG
jgi:flagellar basal-body rod protein FlgB